MYSFTKNRCSLPTYMLSAVLGALMLTLVLSSTPASASAPNARPANYTSIAAAPNGGYWIQVDKGEDSYTLAIDGAPQYASVPKPGSIIAIPGTTKYWVVTRDGYIYARGGAPELCGGNPGWLSNCSGYSGTNNPITAAAASPNGDGLWAVDYYRHVWTAGNVISYGDVTNDNRTPTGIVATPSGKGYYIVMNDGGVFARGDAVFYGSTGGNKPGGRDATGIALNYDLTGKPDGYWLIANDGGVFSFGDAPFLGSTGGNDGGSTVTSIVTRPDQHSYAWVHANGNVELSSTIPKVLIDDTAPADAGVWGVQNNEPNTGIYRLPANGSTSQQWNLFPTNQDSTIVQIVNVSSGLCADVQNVSGPFIIQYPCKGSTDGWDNQRFMIETPNSGCGSNPPCVDLSPVSSLDEQVGNGANAQLMLITFSGGFWKIVPVNSNSQPPNGPPPNGPPPNNQPPNGPTTSRTHRAPTP
jgi:hypothetical protein